jgi:hypothetical protein
MVVVIDSSAHSGHVQGMRWDFKLWSVERSIDH